MNMEQQSAHGDLRGVIAMLRRRLPLIVLAVAVGIGGALLFSRAQKKEYAGTSVLLFKPLLLDAQLTGLPLQVQSSDPQRETATDIGLVSLPQVRARAAAALGPGYTADKLKHDVSVSPEGKSSLVSVKGTASTPTAAAGMANAMVDAFIAYRRQLLVDRIDKAAKSIASQLKHTRGLSRLQQAALRNNATKLAQLRAVQPGDVELVSHAQPDNTPSSPKTALNVVLGGVLGGLLGLALALGAEQLDRRVRRPDEVEGALDLPLLGAIPRSRVLRASKGMANPLSASDIEAFRLLRANLRYRAGSRDLRSVLLTSAGSGSGKTTVALFLAAAAAAASDGRVLLIEADMRRPRLAGLLGLSTDQGLSWALESSQALEDAVVTVPGGHARNGSGPNGAVSFGASFDLLPAGQPHAAASELLGSERMSDLLATATEHYDLTIIDGPPPGFVSDSIPLIKQVDGVVLVAGLGHENSDELKHLRTELNRLGVTPLGVVANFSRRKSNPYVSSGKR
jgi:polysaccharide biosynthesis transport protein